SYRLLEGGPHDGEDQQHLVGLLLPRRTFEELVTQVLPDPLGSREVGSIGVFGKDPAFHHRISTYDGWIRFRVEIQCRNRGKRYLDVRGIGPREGLSLSYFQ